MGAAVNLSSQKKKSEYFVFQLNIWIFQKINRRNLQIKLPTINSEAQGEMNQHYSSFLHVFQQYVLLMFSEYVTVFGVQPSLLFQSIFQTLETRTAILIAA